MGSQWNLGELRKEVAKIKLPAEILLLYNQTRVAESECTREPERLQHIKSSIKIIKDSKILF